MDSTDSDQPFDWTFSLPPQPVNPTNLQGSGLVCETKHFDSFYNASGDRIILPSGQKYKSKKAQADESALTVTNFWDEDQDLERTVLEIKSPFMKAALKAAVPEYATFNIDVKNISITGEPRCLFHYRDELASYGATLEQNQDPEGARHVQHLISYMWEVLVVEIAAFNVLELLQDFEPSLEHKYLWMLFRPGDIVWILEGYGIGYDGDNFGSSFRSAIIEPYEGVKPLKELSAINLDRLPEEKKRIVKEELIARGRKFVSIHGQQCFWYSENRSKCSDGWTKTRIIADTKGYDTWEGGQLKLTDEKPKFKPEEAPQKMTEGDLMICHNRVKGYSLRENKWGNFEVDFISDISYDSNAFDALILPDDQKQHLLSLVRTHEDDSFFFGDLVKGKGTGTTFLLYGEPGVGKTLTAESIADRFEKPLLRLDAGTLGTSPSSVESGLKRAFDLAERWHALLLLDEADVYLEQRMSKSLIHNGIVSVFLRRLEYFHGILFLTTNRISSFDTAFSSRIHLALYYPPLSQSSRRTLLYTFLQKVSKTSADNLSHDGILKKISKEKLNGRQIRNLVQSACALAHGDTSAKGDIKKYHLETALRPMKQFTRRMEKVSGCDRPETPVIEIDNEGNEIEKLEEYTDSEEEVEDHEGSPGFQQNKRRRLI
ncbi:P-loop containing nucleoside triphosphate hydrolase protein [Fusarium austroafricanum]|uniref:P-loop containing nucleoside triphosphate hydrolase protein n=1 Tax=Fusarium austroafricanum TaxID=2364996 RepID=A0A8H4KEE9_9HYPO|nr:P-loop containing nucleoside triphosphate hydrolase protein [Fusarium austroafricanum]